jgi:hypothetical protein
MGTGLVSKTYDKPISRIQNFESLISQNITIYLIYVKYWS